MFKLQKTMSLSLGAAMAGCTWTARDILGCVPAFIPLSTGYAPNWLNILEPKGWARPMYRVRCMDSIDGNALFSAHFRNSLTAGVMDPFLLIFEMVFSWMAASTNSQDLQLFPPSLLARSANDIHRPLVTPLSDGLHNLLRSVLLT